MKHLDNRERPFKYSKLRARTVELEYRDKDVAAACKMTATTYSFKLNGKAEFTQSEIRDICAFLQIEASDIPLYFFTQRV